MGSISNIASSYLQSMLPAALQGIGLGNSSTANSLGSIGNTAATTDSQQLSPFAQVMSELQQLQQSDPAQYQQVTAQVATNLQTAAQTAQSNGNSTAAAQLNQLSTDFSGASKSGQLPSVQDLAQAIHGGHHHRHHAQAASSDPDGNSSSTSPSSSSSLNQFLAAFQSNGTPNDALNPAAIILNTLSNAGIGNSSGA